MSYKAEGRGFVKLVDIPEGAFYTCRVVEWALENRFIQWRRQHFRKFGFFRYQVHRCASARADEALSSAREALRVGDGRRIARMEKVSL